MAKSVRIVRESEVRRALDMGACIEACERAFIAYSSGAAELPGVIHLDVPESRGEIHVKAGHLHGARHYAVKVASGFHAQDPPAIDGLVMVFDARDGSPAAFLLDNGYLTNLRTGAAGGVAARYLAPGATTTVAVIGTGEQARRQLDALSLARPGLTDVRIWGRKPDHAEVCASALREALPAATGVTVAATVPVAVDGADVVITCTAAREPLVRSEWLKPGAHVTAVGSDGAGKQELDPQILRNADVLVVDSREQCLALGELQHAPQEVARAVELGAVCAGDASGRASDQQLTVCDLTGLGVQDVAAANAVLEHIEADGDRIEL